VYEFAQAFLVHGVDERKEQADGDRFDALEFQAAYHRSRDVLVERADDLAAKIEAFGYAESPTPGCDRHRRWEGRIPDLFFVSAPYLDLVAMTFGGSA
jgi:hypothetical protein